jgi:hypothetical protein
LRYCNEESLWHAGGYAHGVNESVGLTIAMLSLATTLPVSHGNSYSGDEPRNHD